MKRLIGISALLMCGGAQAGLIVCTTDNNRLLRDGVFREVTYQCGPGAGSDPGSQDDNLASDGRFIEEASLDTRVGSFRVPSGAPGMGYVNDAGPLGTWTGDCTSSAGLRAPCVDDTFRQPYRVPGNPDTLSAFIVRINAFPLSGRVLPRDFSVSGVSYEVKTSAASLVPEPTSAALVATALWGVALARRRRLPGR